MSSDYFPLGRGRGARRSTAASDRAVLAAASHLTARDRLLVRAVGEHRVLTTGQLTALGFGSVITARHRLAVLVQIGVLRRFRPHRETGSAPWHYLLGPVGAALLGAEDRDERSWLTAVRADRQLALEQSQRLVHTVRVNWFFAALAAHARQVGGEARLRTWLNETATTDWLLARVPATYGIPGLPHPDGLGIWAEHGREATFLLEYDTGSEHLPQLTAKLTGYGNVAKAMADLDNICPLLLFCFPTPAASKPPGAPWRPATTPRRCGSPPPRSTRSRPARPGRCGSPCGGPPTAEARWRCVRSTRRCRTRGGATAVGRNARASRPHSPASRPPGTKAMGLGGMSEGPSAPPSPSDPAPRRTAPAAPLDKVGRDERPCTQRWAAGQPGPHGEMGSPAPPGSRAGPTAHGHASTTARPGVPVARAETIAMTATEHDDAVEAVAALIFRTWDDKAEAA